MFGKRSPRSRGAGDAPGFAKFLAVATALMACFMLMALAGCGGGGDSGDTNGSGNSATNNGGSTSRDAIISGTVIDQNNGNQPVANATVRFSDRQTTTGNDGRFSLAIPANTSGVAMTIVGPALAGGGAGYYDSGFVGQTQYSLANSGIVIPALAEEQLYDLGNIIIFGTSGPPPPPLFP